MKQSSYKIFPPLPQPGSVSRNGWWALWAQKRRRKRAQDVGPDPGFVPEDMQLWLQASSLGEGPGDSVSNWQDDSGNVNDATQISASMQPTLQEVTFAGKTFPVLRFDTVDDGMETPLVIADGTPFSIFVIWRPAVLVGGSSSAIISSGSLDWTMGTYGNGMLCYFTSWTAGSAVDTTNFFLFEARIVPGVHPYAIYMNGVQAGIEPTAASAAPEQVMLGASGSNNYPGNGDCAEVLIYDRFLSGDEADGVRAYFQSRYNFLKL